MASGSTSFEAIETCNCYFTATIGLNILSTLVTSKPYVCVWSTGQNNFRQFSNNISRQSFFVLNFSLFVQIFFWLFVNNINDYRCTRFFRFIIFTSRSNLLLLRALIIQHVISLRYHSIQGSVYLCSVR
jgi:hypothetical protein